MYLDCLGTSTGTGAAESIKTSTLGNMFSSSLPNPQKQLENAKKKAISKLTEVVAKFEKESNPSNTKGFGGYDGNPAFKTYKDALIEMNKDVQTMTDVNVLTNLVKNLGTLKLVTNVKKGDQIYFNYGTASNLGVIQTGDRNEIKAFFEFLVPSAV